MADNEDSACSIKENKTSTIGKVWNWAKNTLTGQEETSSSSTEDNKAPEDEILEEDSPGGKKRFMEEEDISTSSTKKNKASGEKTLEKDPPGGKKIIMADNEDSACIIKENKTSTIGKVLNLAKNTLTGQEDNKASEAEILEEDSPGGKKRFMEEEDISTSSTKKNKASVEKTLEKDPPGGKKNTKENASEYLKRSLHSVKISKYDATEFERNLQGQLFDKWHESCEVMKAMEIPKDSLKDFLDHLEDAYDGIGKTERKKMNGILHSGEWSHRIIDWKFNKNDNSGAKYGMIVFSRSPDREFVDCMFVIYKMDFLISPKEIVTIQQHSALWRLLNWQTESVSFKPSSLGMKDNEILQNYFRFKALEGFYKEGLIDSINYVSSLEEARNQPK